MPRLYEKLGTRTLTSVTFPSSAMLRLLPLLLALAVLGGCREDLTGPDSVGNPPPASPPLDVRSMYVKAPPVISEGEVVDVRAEPLAGAVRYDWTLSGEGDANLSPNDPQGRRRVLAALGVQAGELLITARAFDADGELLAVGSKPVYVARH